MSPWKTRESVLLQEALPKNVCECVLPEDTFSFYGTEFVLPASVLRHIKFH